MERAGVDDALAIVRKLKAFATVGLARFHAAGRAEAVDCPQR
jgi:hypothetical protein